MNWLEALILGIVQGLTEFLPISSSGHIELGKAIFSITEKENLSFTIVVHFATVLSIVTVYWQDIWQLTKSTLTFKNTDENKFVLKLLLSAIPVAILGFTAKDYIEQLFTGNVLLVSIFLLVTALLLFIAHYAKEKSAEITYWDALIIGIAQAIAVLPGISRSGATISTSLILGKDKTQATRFSFLMVIIPILGIVAKDIYDNISNALFFQSTNIINLLLGFVAAYLVGVVACNFMIKVVRNSKLIYFAIYCLTVALIGISVVIFK